MNFKERRRRNGPVFKSRQKAHEEVLANEFWFGDGVPVIGKQFTAEKAKERKDKVVDVLYRTARRERRAGDAGVADRLEILADKIVSCHQGRRCDSLPCPGCHRALQKAKVAAQEIIIKRLKVARNSKLLVMANVIPLWIADTPEEFADLDVRNLNRRLKAAQERFLRELLPPEMWGAEP